MRSLRPFTIAFAVFALTRPADAQTICLYTMLVEAHEMVTHCGDTLDDSVQQRYSKYVLSLATLMIENTPSLKGHTDPQTWNSNYEMNIHKRYSVMDQSICRKPEYSRWKTFLGSMTSEEGAAKIDKVLNAPKYPGDNGCL